jgi:hypothetical protein
MRYLWLGFAAAVAFGLANAPVARAFDTQIDDNTNADGSPRFADPDEPLEALADGGGGGSAYTYKLSDLDISSRRDHAAPADHSVPWTPEHIRLVFGPYAH